MTQETKIIGIIGAIAIIAALLIFYTPFLEIFFKSTGPNNIIAAIPMSNIKKPASGAETKNPDTSYLRDPFYLDYRFEKSSATTETQTPATTESESKKKSYLVLNGVFINSDGNVAIIDDKMYSRGQLVYGWTILGVYPDRVVLNKRGVTKILKLKVGVE